MSETNSHPDVVSESGDSTYCYLRSGDKVVGPIMMNRLRQMGRQGKISTDDLVRKGKTGDWVTAGSIPGLLIAAPVVPEPIEKEEEQTETLPPAPGPLARFIDSTLGGGAAFFQNSFGWFAGNLRFLRVIGSWAALAVVAVVLTQMILGSSLWELAALPEPYAKFQSIGDQLIENRSRKISEADWDAFAEKVKLEVKPLVSRLERTASVTNRQDQQLLWAGRDCLPKMLKDARGEQSAAERKFIEHMKNVEHLRHGRDLYGGRLRTRFPGLSRAFYSLGATEIGAVLFVVVDIAAVVWLIRMWRGGKRKPA